MAGANQIEPERLFVIDQLNRFLKEHLETDALFSYNAVMLRHEAPFSSIAEPSYLPLTDTVENRHFDWSQPVFYRWWNGEIY